MAAVIRGNGERERGAVNGNLGGSVYRTQRELGVVSGGSFVVKRVVTLVSALSLEEARPQPQ